MPNDSSNDLDTGAAAVIAAVTVVLICVRRRARMRHSADGEDGHSSRGADASSAASCPVSSDHGTKGLNTQVDCRSVCAKSHCSNVSFYIHETYHAVQYTLAGE